MISILIVEDHQLLSKVLATILERKEGFNVAKVVHTADAAIKELPNLAVDIALVDLSLPQMSGIDLVAYIRKNYPHLPCLVMSAHTDQDGVEHALANGARGYIVKDDMDDMDEVVEGIHQVLKGRVYLSKLLRNNGSFGANSNSLYQSG
jgi:DNA-binding NarL/FixJ family response regulator